MTTYSNIYDSVVLTLSLGAWRSLCLSLVRSLSLSLSLSREDGWVGIGGGGGLSLPADPCEC